MKRTRNKFLALLLVLTMVIGIIPFAVISAGAAGVAAGASENAKVKFAYGAQLLGEHSTAAQGGAVTAPQAVMANMFGWYGVVTNGSTTKTMLIKPEQTVNFNRGDTAVFKPLTLDITQDPTPTLRMKDEDTAGMRFIAGVSKASYRDLLAMIERGELANATVSFGMSFEAPNGETTSTPFQMVLDANNNPVWYDETTTVGYIAGTVWVDDIEEMLDGSDIALNTAGIIATGYAKLTFGGTDYYAYAENNDKKASTIYELAIEALNKVSVQQSSSNKLQIGKYLYSPYSVSERAVMSGFVDNVVSMKTADDGSTASLITHSYYNPNSKWRITEVTAADSDWADLLEQLGEDVTSDIVLICKLEAKNASASAQGGILLDGALFEGVMVENAGNPYYLIGFSDHTPGN